MTAEDAYLARVESVQLLWDEQQRVFREAVRARARARARAKDAAEAEAAKKLFLLHRTLVESAAVRLVSCWEVFVSELFTEYLLRRPQRYRVSWSLRGKSLEVTEATVDTIVQQANRPFQSLERALELLKRYMGKDVIGAVDLAHVKAAISVRNAIVHRGGAPTREFREILRTKMTAYSFLMSRPAGTTVPASRFEALLLGVTSTVLALYERTWQRPRP